MKLLDSFINDRRLAKRYDMLVKLNYYNPLTKEKKEAITKNISSSGLRFPVEGKLAKDTIMDLNIEDPNSDKYLSRKGKVVWIEDFACGNTEVGVKLLNKKIF